LEWETRRKSIDYLREASNAAALLIFLRPHPGRHDYPPHDRNYWVHITRCGGYKTLTDTKGFSSQDLYGWEIGEITDAAQVFRYSISTNMRCQPKGATV